MEKAVKEDMRSVISIFKKAPEQIKISVADMITNLLETSTITAKYEAAMTELQERGLTALYAALQAAGIPYTEAIQLLLDDASAAAQLEIDLRFADYPNLGMATEQVRAEIAGMLGRATAAPFPVNIPVRPSIGGDVPNPEGHAMGGPVSAGTPYIVGEQGPELFVPNQSGTIVPNGETSGRTVNVYVERVESDDLAGDIAEGLIRASITEQVDLIGVW